MYLYHNIDSNSILNIEHMYARETIIHQLKDRFTTYGYREISASIFEKYNLYATMNSTVNHLEMIKTIDNTGQVLVLRPDITIPLTKQIASKQGTLAEDLRYFYVLDVYRQTNETKEYIERTQAGVEYFGNPSPEADAEVIALAAHMLNDLNIDNFKIELGHANFFKQLFKDVKINGEDFRQLEKLVRAKNIPEIDSLLKRLELPEEINKIIASLPFLYGNFSDVLQKTEKLPLSEQLQQILNNIKDIYSVLDAYGFTDHITIDLSLINHMNYYSGIIFQGFIEQVGKPILMGGRYDSLAEHFNAEFPAIGFACDLDLLLVGLNQEEIPQLKIVDIALVYEKDLEHDAIQLAQQLRSAKYDVLTYTSTEQRNFPKTTAQIYFGKDNKKIIVAGEERLFYTNDHLLEIVKNIWKDD